MPTGKKQKALQEVFQQTLDQDLEGRVLDFDVPAALEAAASLKAAGRIVDIRDVQIAGIVAARRGTLATRNTKHFIHTKVTLIKPWKVTLP